MSVGCYTRSANYLHTKICKQVDTSHKNRYNRRNTEWSRIEPNRKALADRNFNIPAQPPQQLSANLFSTTSLFSPTPFTVYCNLPGFLYDCIPPLVYCTRSYSHNIPDLASPLTQDSRSASHIPQIPRTRTDLQRQQGDLILSLDKELRSSTFPNNVPTAAIDIRQATRTTDTSHSLGQASRTATLHRQKSGKYSNLHPSQLLHLYLNCICLQVTTPGKQDYITKLETQHQLHNT